MSERIKQAWNGESTLKGRLGGYVLGRTNAEAIAIPLSAPVIVISEQEIEMPALQERSIRVHLTKMKRKYCREHFRRATEGCEHLRRLGKAIMATSLTTSPEDIKRLMEKKPRSYFRKTWTTDRATRSKWSWWVCGCSWIFVGNCICSMRCLCWIQ
ncbi:hypothetical protein ACFS4T_11635 [Pseudomonas lini]